MKTAALLAIVTIGLLGLLVPSNAPQLAPTEKPLLGDELQRAIEANRASATARADRKVEDLLYPYTGFADAETVAQITFSEDGPLRTVTFAEAQEDIVFLFEMFKYGYCMYAAFGGDEAFDEAREAILDELEGDDSTDAVRVRGSDGTYPAALEVHPGRPRRVRRRSAV